MADLQPVVCPGCPLLCDDILISINDSQRHVKNACPLGQQFFDQPIPESVQHFLAGQPATIDAAVLQAAKILSHAAAPLICGLESLTTQAQQVAWKLAEKTGASIDSTLSDSNRASMFALQRVGKVTATLGEIATRSDLIVFWFCDPLRTHPRLLERLDRVDRKSSRAVVVVDEQETDTTEIADHFIRLKPSDAVAFLAAVRATLNGIPQPTIQLDGGIDGSVIEKFGSQLSDAQYGCVFFGQPVSDSAFDPTTHSLHTLIRNMNNITRFVGIKLRNDRNAQSAENVISWSTGYPFAVNHSLAFPRFNGLEFSASQVLNRGECDSILVAADNDLDAQLSELPKPARKHFLAIPRIVLGPLQAADVEVGIQVGIPGLTNAGEFCRLDDVSLPLTSVLGTSAPSSVEVLERILAAI